MTVRTFTVLPTRSGVLRAVSERKILDLFSSRLAAISLSGYIFFGSSVSISDQVRARDVTDDNFIGPHSHIPVVGDPFWCENRHQVPDWRCSTAPVEDFLAWQILHDMQLQNRRSAGFRLHARHFLQ